MYKISAFPIVFSMVICVCIFVISIGVGHYLNIYFSLIPFIFLIPIFLAAIVTRWYGNRDNDSWITLIAWLNLLTWLFPALGVFTSLLTIQYSDPTPDKYDLYWVLGILGLFLSVANGLVGLYAKIVA